MSHHLHHHGLSSPPLLGAPHLSATRADPPNSHPAMPAPPAFPARPVPTLSVQSPDTNHSTAIVHYDSVVTPNGVHSSNNTPMPSTPASPPAIISTASTPIVPRSAATTQRNPFPTSPSAGASTGAGSKRTASGTVKTTSTSAESASIPSSPAAPVTPASPARFPRSQASIDTSPRNVSQLSSQLKTRLTYALLKVQNNWTSESLDQVEARVSQGQHPTSPRIRIKRECIIGDEAGFDHILRHHRTNSEPSSAHPLSQNHPAGSAGRTYESFWREHEHNPITKKILQAKAASQVLGSNTHKHAMPLVERSISRSGLQPPAQIIPDRDRRTFYNPVRQPPGLYQSYSNQSNASVISMTPNTPPPAGTPDTQRTMEQDAVESLMFLSSPGHSQRRSSQTMHTSQSQLRALAEIIVDVEEPPSSQQDNYSYGRNATTWPRGRKQARTGLGTLQMTDSGVGFDDELTDEDMAESYQGAIDKGKQRENAIMGPVPGGTRIVGGGVIGTAAAAAS